MEGEGEDGGPHRGKGLERGRKEREGRDGKRGGRGRETEGEGGDVGPLRGKGVQGRGERKGKEEWGTNPYS